MDALYGEGNREETTQLLTTTIKSFHDTTLLPQALIHAASVMEYGLQYFEQRGTHSSLHLSLALYPVKSPKTTGRTSKLRVWETQEWMDGWRLGSCLLSADLLVKDWVASALS